MNKRSLGALLCSIAALACGAPASAPSEAAAGVPLLRARHPIAERYLIVLREPAGAATDVEATASDLAQRHGAELIATWRQAVRGFAARMNEASASAMAADPRVAWVEEDGTVSVAAIQKIAPWNLDRIDQRRPPLDGSYSYPPGGSSVTAYLIDTGVRASHVEIAGRVARGFTSVDDGHGTDDCNGHGTHVAGVVGGKTYGVAKGVRLVPVRVLDCSGSGPVSAVVAGIDWVTANHASPAVANISLGTGGSATLDAAVQRSIASGVSYTVAAGNGGADACAQSPARVGPALTVGATDQADGQASFSNFGSCVDIYAPGVNITSAWSSSDTAINTLSGTSMASPQVTGAAALYLSANPSATPAQVSAALLSQATSGMTGLGAGSPDRLLFTGFVPVQGELDTAIHAAGCGGGAAQLLADGGFEGDGTAWVGTGGVIDASASPGARTGRWKAWLAGYGSAHRDDLFQTMAIPADACGVTFSFWLHVTTEEPGTAANDLLTVSVDSPEGATLAALASFSNLDASPDYVERRFDLTAFRGTTVRLRFHAEEDDLLQTSFLVDDAALIVERP